MCGIGGITLMPPGPIKSEWLNAFLQNLGHRGPDDCGWVSWYRGRCRQGRGVEHDLVGELLFVHRRLSILDLSDAGHQPMSSPDGRYWITFNGEIYNYVELREELKALGQTFRSNSDTEVLLAAYTKWGIQCLNRLVGMFAFAVIDIQRRSLVLARDFFGIKPLFYSFWQEGIAFCSEIMPLLKLPGVSREVNPQRLYDYLYSGLTDHGVETLFAQVRQLPAAHYLEVPMDDARSSELVRYWDIDRAQRVDVSVNEAAKRIRELFLDSVRLHLRSDVPVGAALSGGIDSSSIVSAMRQLEPNLNIHTFSYVAEDPRISEERWVDLVGKEERLQTHKIYVSSGDLLADMDRLIGEQGEPFSSTSMYAQWRVFQSAREAGIKVMLDGQGADELLAGYPNYRVSRISSLLSAGRINEALRLARRVSTAGGWWKLILRAAMRMAPANLQNGLRRMLGRNTMPSWLNRGWFAEHGVKVVDVTPICGPHFLREELYQTLTATSLPQLLRYEDRNSMAFSIESRVPFLTPALVQYIQALPESHLVAADGTSKAVFRQAMRGIVPDAILDRNDKVGFPTPEQDWLSSQRLVVRRILGGEPARNIAALNVTNLLRDWEGMMQGTQRVDAPVWRWINLILWTKKFAVAIE